MGDDDLLRYSKSILLKNVGITGQETLNNSTALIIGLGGLGSPSSQYLASSGVGHLILADFDKVELSNLQRQTIHYTSDIGKLKIKSVQEKLLKINPNIKITLVESLENCLDDWIQKSDIVLDGTDNFTSRFAINESCIKNKTPLVSASVIRLEGQIAVFKGYEKNKPCYECLYKKGDFADDTCSNSGVFPPFAGVLGTLQATMALKVLLNLGELLDEKLLLIDGEYMDFRTIKLNKDKKCLCCKNT
jgi:molybdopterin/thiamine biosynthesis adenylyltransferase